MGKQWRHKEIISGLNKSPPKLGRIPEIHEDWGQPMSLFPTNQNGSFPYQCHVFCCQTKWPARHLLPCHVVHFAVQLGDELLSATAGGNRSWIGEKWRNMINRRESVDFDHSSHIPNPRMSQYES